MCIRVLLIVGAWSIGMSCEARKFYDFTPTNENKPESLPRNAESQTFTIDGVEWFATCTKSKGSYYWDWSTNNGLKIGSGNNTISDATLSTSSLLDRTITKIVVDAGRNKEKNVSLSVSVGGVPFLCDGKEEVDVEYADNVPKYEYVFEYEGGASGEIVIHYTVNNDAVYFYGVRLYDDEPLIDPEVSYSASFVGFDTDDIQGDVLLPTLSCVDGFIGTIVYTSSNKSVAEVDEEGEVMFVGGVGRTTITASVVEDDAYSAAEASYALLVKEPHTFDFEVHSYDMPIHTDESYETGVYYLEGKQSIKATLEGSYRLFDAGSVRLQLSDGSITFVSPEDEEISRIVISGAALSALECDVGSLSVEDESATWAGRESSVTLTAPSLIELITIDITLSPAVIGTGTLQIIADEGYATFYTDEAYIMPTGVIGTRITGLTSDKLVMNWEYGEGEIVPAGTALLLYGVPDTYSYDVVAPSAAVALTGNMLYGSTEDVYCSVDGATAGYLFYMLSYDQGGKNMGFYWAEEEGAPFLSGAFKAWLAIESNTNVPKHFILADDPAGILSPSGSSSLDGRIYDLRGVRHSAPTAKGIYIIGGRKVVVR